MMMDRKDYDEKEEEKVEAMDILEESWFFHNLLINNNNNSTRKSPRKMMMMMPRFNSDIPSHEYQLVKNVKKKEEDLNERIRSKVILRQPSDPTVLLQAAASNNNEADDFAVMKEVNNYKKKSYDEINGRRRSKLLRTPSLPPSSIGRKDQIHIFPQNQPSKSYSIPRSGTWRNTDQGERITNNTEGIKEMRRRYLNQRRMRKSLSDLEFEEVQGFKDLGFSFEKERINPSVANILPGLQEKNREETEEDKAMRRPYLSEAWLVQSYNKFVSPPPIIPNCASSSDHKSSKDMKAHIKFWARAVASNVRQEC